MNNSITGFVGLDVHAKSTAISFAKAGRAKPRFVGTVGVKRSELTKALSQLGEPASLLVVYEAGPCGYTLVRELAAQATTARWWLQPRSRAGRVIGSRLIAVMRCSWQIWRARAF